MNRFFFDFDGITDNYGINLPSANNACVEAIKTMPQFAAEKLERDGGIARVTCSIRENDSSASFKIVVSMHVEDASGAVVHPPFRLDEVA